jgi:hypothetical protein
LTDWNICAEIALQSCHRVGCSDAYLAARNGSPSRIPYTVMLDGVISTLVFMGFAN